MIKCRWVPFQYKERTRSPGEDESRTRNWPSLWSRLSAWDLGIPPWYLKELGFPLFNWIDMFQHDVATYHAWDSRRRPSWLNSRSNCRRIFSGSLWDTYYIKPTLRIIFLNYKLGRRIDTIREISRALELYMWAAWFVWPNWGDLRKKKFLSSLSVRNHHNQAVQWISKERACLKRDASLLEGRIAFQTPASNPP